MKILKKAEQKNLTLNVQYYTVHEINEMLAREEICYFTERFTPTHYPVANKYTFQFRIFTEDLKELKVVLDESNFYTTVAIGKNGKTYFVNI